MELSETDYEEHVLHIHRAGLCPDSRCAEMSDNTGEVFFLLSFPRVEYRL